MATGFLSPSVLFRGITDVAERAYLHPLFGHLRDHYQRFVEPCAGGFGNISLAVGAGWDPKQIEASDVQLFSAVLGAVTSGTPLDELEVRVDGRKLRLPRDSAAAGARILWSHLRLRTESDPAVYGQQIHEDVIRRQAEHEAAIARKLEALADTVGGLTYHRMGLWEHLDRVLDDPTAVVNMGPPSVTRGYERFYDTDGRLTWAEPTYATFDVETGLRELVEMCDGRKALVLIEEQQAPRKSSHPQPVYARDLSEDWRVYILSNRPKEVFGYMGGMKIGARQAPASTKPAWPILPSDYEITPETRVAIVPVGGGETAWLRDLWVHKLPTIGSTSGNFVVLLDGQVAGLAALSVDPIIRPYPNQKERDALLMRFAVGAPHSLRLTRLVTRLCLLRSTAEAVLAGKSRVWADSARRVCTVEYSRFREAKGLRGLMKRDKVNNHRAGWALSYSAPLEDTTPEEALKQWLVKEEQWRASRSSN